LRRLRPSSARPSSCWLRTPWLWPGMGEAGREVAPVRDAGEEEGRMAWWAWPSFQKPLVLGLVDTDCRIVLGFLLLLQSKAGSDSDGPSFCPSTTRHASAEHKHSEGDMLVVRSSIHQKSLDSGIF
jgi:hypothetical protein